MLENYRNLSDSYLVIKLLYLLVIKNYIKILRLSLWTLKRSTYSVHYPTRLYGAAC